jgi:hypothetical protein
MRWHAERKKPKDDDDDDQEDMILRHPSDASQWKALDIECPEFGNDPRNVRLGVSTDGLNPFGSRAAPIAPGLYLYGCTTYPPSCG